MGTTPRMDRMKHALLGALGVLALFAFMGQTRPDVYARMGLWDGANFQDSRQAALATYTVASTLTARNSIGAALLEKGSRWMVVSFPAANAQGTASIASETGVRHVVDCVTWAADAGAAVTAAAGNLAVRDGSTGAGTVIWQVAVAHQVAAGAGVQTIPPNTVCGLNLVGTTATAMTAEFNAGVTGEVQSVSISGFNVQ